MDYNMNNLIPFIPPSEYDRVAEQFLEEYCPEALKHPMAIPIEKIAADMGLKVQYVCLSEEADIYGATIFTDGALEIYEPEEDNYLMSSLTIVDNTSKFNYGFSFIRELKLFSSYNFKDWDDGRQNLLPDNYQYLLH